MRILLLTVALVGCGTDLSDSSTDPSTCGSCNIDLRPVAALDFSDAPFMPTMFANVERLSDGTFVVVDHMRGGKEILHFSEGGSFIDSHVREGSGPGEAKEIHHVLAIGDSLLVMDAGLARCTVLDAEFGYVRDFECPGASSDAAFVGGRLFLAALSPTGLDEIDPANGERAPSKSEGESAPVSDVYASIASDSAGVWFVAHPSEYRLSYWRLGDANRSRSIERHPAWWQHGERFLFTQLPAGARLPSRQAGEERQVMRGPLLFNIALSDGLIWTASYIHTRKDRQYFDFLMDWLNQGLQGDVTVILEALTQDGELVASAEFDSIAPPRFTAGGLMYTIDKERDGTGITLYGPAVIPARQ